MAKLQSMGILAAVAFFASAAGCSLVTLKSPERPLSTRDLNARILTREYSARFIGSVEETADEISVATADPAVRINALKWKIVATGKSQRAASQIVPMMSLLDTWAFSVQMRDFLATGAGHELFGDQQALAIARSRTLADEASDLAKRLTTTEEFDKFQRFVDNYAQAHALENLDFARPSVVDLWASEAGVKVRLVDSLGTVPEAMSNAGDLLRMYGDTAPSQVLWRAQLAAQESGVSGNEFHDVFEKFDQRVARFSALAEAAPARFDALLGQARTRFDESWREIFRDIHAERVSVIEQVGEQREAAVKAVEQERAALVADASKLSSQIVRDAGDEARRLVREAMIGVIALFLVVLGLPFAAGYFVGRARRK